MFKSRKGKVRNPCFLCKDMHLTYLFHCMDEASKLLEDIIVTRKWFPIGYCKLSFYIPLVDKVVNPVLTSVDPTLILKSEVEVVELTSSPPNPTLSSESVNIEVISLTQSSSSPSLPIESENHPAVVFVVSSHCSMQEEVLSLSMGTSPSSEVISFYWSNLIESHLHSSVPFQIVIRIISKSILRTIVDEGASVSILSSTT